MGTFLQQVKWTCNQGGQQCTTSAFLHWNTFETSYRRSVESVQCYKWGIET